MVATADFWVYNAENLCVTSLDWTLHRIKIYAYCAHAFFFQLHFELFCTLHMSNTYKVETCSKFCFFSCALKRVNQPSLDQTLGTMTKYCLKPDDLLSFWLRLVCVCIMHRCVSLYEWVELEAFVRAGLRQQNIKTRQQSFQNISETISEIIWIGKRSREQ